MNLKQITCRFAQGFCVERLILMDLILTTSQKLALSQKMMLSAEILQMSSQELIEYIKELSIENPVIELDFNEHDENNDKFQMMKRKLDWLESSDEQNKTYYSQDKEDENENDDWKFKKTAEESLEEYLLFQANVLSLPKHQLSIIRYLIEFINENGYLDDTLDNIAKHLEVDQDKVEEMLCVIQCFEPAGVGARNLQECLLLQLNRKYNIPNYVREIVSNHLEALGKNQVPAIAKKLKITIDDVLNAKEIIKTLNPKPGNSFFTDKTLEYISPDVFVVKNESEYKVILDDRFFPKIHIGNYYKNLYTQVDTSDTKNYIMKKVNQAQWAIKCIEKRNDTLLRTVECIVKNQTDFFDYGHGNLKPLKLIDVSESLELHESTISRAIKDKYLQCSWGIFPLSYFFSTAISTNNNEASVTADNIKEKIKAIISNENTTSPLSDREITEMLVSGGVNISRRTVAKYRESLGIPGTSGRKTF